MADIITEHALEQVRQAILETNQAFTRSLRATRGVLVELQSQLDALSKRVDEHGNAQAADAVILGRVLKRLDALETRDPGGLRD